MGLTARGLGLGCLRRSGRTPRLLSDAETFDAYAIADIARRAMRVRAWFTRVEMLRAGSNSGKACRMIFKRDTSHGISEGQNMCEGYVARRAP
jgi:hypothetical protein